MSDDGAVDNRGVGGAISVQAGSSYLFIISNRVFLGRNLLLID